MKENTHNFIRKTVAIGLTEKAYKLAITDESKSRIDYVKEMIKDRSDLNFLVYFNHICFADPLFAGYVAAKIDPENSRHLIAPISYSHTEKKLKNVGTLAMKTVAEASGLEIRRVIQSYQIDNPKYGYTKQEALNVNKSFFDRLKDLSKTDKPVGCIICPEGHRSDNGQLMRGEEGITLINRILQPVVGISVGISFDGEYSRNGVNVGKKLNITVGEIFVSEKKDKRVDLDFLMSGLAESLPPEMRGVWAKNQELLGE